MSTRAQIVVEFKDEDSKTKIYECIVYKHSDGYPKGVLPFLEEFAKQFRADRGDDPAYCIAQMLRHWSRYDLKEGTDGWGIDTVYHGWGIDTVYHGDIEYLYVVKLDGSVEVRTPTSKYWDKQCFENTKKYENKNEK